MRFLYILPALLAWHHQKKIRIQRKAKDIREFLLNYQYKLVRQQQVHQGLSLVEFLSLLQQDNQILTIRFLSLYPGHTFPMNLAQNLG
ncbi:MAG: hypothetical protein B6230_04730 [Desulfobacteraceae bacterium 4572_89]|nr:MAG: hypothetical protein B6230_04730 [Desulfobacteraceae bacterium 4572_89]